MLRNDSLIRLRISLLLISYFQRTITATEQAELDAWLEASPANQRVFEDCLEMTLRPKRKIEIDYHDEDNDVKLHDAGQSGYYARIANILFKKLQGPISTTESAELEKWKLSSTRNNHLYHGLAGSPDLHALFEWVINRFWLEHPNSNDHQ